MDYLVSFIVWVLAVYGTALVIVQSTLMKPVRDRVSEWKWKLPGKLINCIMCTGWWSGAFWGTFFWNPSSFADGFFLLDTIFSGMVGCATTWMIALFLAPYQRGM